MGGGGMGALRRPADVAQLGRSHSEALPMGQQQQHRGYPSGDNKGGSLMVSRESRKGRSLKSKRKLKMKSKMKFTREDGVGGMASAPKVREERK
jgi:hypothetical protein